MEELLFKSGVRDGQDLGQMEKGGAFPKRGHSYCIAAVVCEFQGGAL